MLMQYRLCCLHSFVNTFRKYCQHFRSLSLVTDCISSIVRSLSLVTRLYFIHKLHFCSSVSKCEVLTNGNPASSPLVTVYLGSHYLHDRYFQLLTSAVIHVCAIKTFSGSYNIYIHKRLHHANDVMSTTLSLLFRRTAAKFSNPVQK